MLTAKRGTTSFSTIVGVIGAILIGVGVAWLIAQNWNIMSAAVKIAILVIAVGASFTAATLLRERGYQKTSVGLLVLGALLYTLSIFLIAQIYSTSTTVQGAAWLLLLAWLGVLIAAYLYESRAILIIGLLQSFIWLLLQESAWNAFDHALGILALHLLAIGILLYGLRLWHRDHAFGRTYLLFTVVYALLCAYILSFQGTVSFVWSGTVQTRGVIALIALLAISLITVLIASRKGSDKRERTGAIVVLLLLLSVVGIAIAATGSVGSCQPHNCYEQKTVASCAQAPANLTCIWQDGYCTERNCYALRSMSACEDTTDDIACDWYKGTCREHACYNYDNSNDCWGSDLNCTWTAQDVCKGSDESDFKDGLAVDKRWEACQQFTNQHDACTAQDACMWQAEPTFSYAKQGVPPIAWTAWIWANIVFLAVILLIIGLGTTSRDAAVINLGIVAFGLMILTRYIGFMIDLWGYTSLAFVFITGGIVLLAGGFGIERLRRKLVEGATPAAAKSYRAAQRKNQERPAAKTRSSKKIGARRKVRR
jgi:uncharacterized membrane protein